MNLKKKDTEGRTLTVVLMWQGEGTMVRKFRS